MRSVFSHVTKICFPLTRSRSLLVALSVASVALVAAACGGDATEESSPTPSGAAATQPSAAASGSAVSVKTFKFDPTPLKVVSGTKVTWTNNDEILHTITSGAPAQADGKFDGQLSGQGTSFSFTFATPGTYSYFCDRHNGMRGEVVVS